MKKLVYVIAIVLGGIVLNAAEVPKIQNVLMEQLSAQDFTEIATSDLPQAVIDALTTDFPSATLNKAYVNSEGQYKLEIAKEDGSTAALYADAEGNWLEM
jgi:predicted peptidase